jgi:prepilin-type N-terminal cleavage/methylation domain-containing protein
MSEYLKNKNESGFSLLEILVALTVFAFLALVATQSIFSTVRVSTKSASVVKIRGDVDYALSVIERYLHSAQSVTPCPLDDPKTVAFIDSQGSQTIFSCVTPGETGYLASGSARLTSETVAVTTCSFVCAPATGNTPASVTISVEAKDATKTGIDRGTVTTSTQIYLRNF